MADNSEAKTAAAAGAGEGAGAGSAPAPITAELKQKIRKQVEFYFSKHNLPTDKFLRGNIAKDPERWVPMEIMMKFNRLKALSEDGAVVADALKDSTLVEVSEDGSKIRRVEKLDDVSASTFDSATIYAVRRACAEHRGAVSAALLTHVGVHRRKVSPTTLSWRTSRRRLSRSVLSAASPCAAPRAAAEHSRYASIPPLSLLVPRALTPSCVVAGQGSVFVTFENEDAAHKAVEGGIKFMGRPLEKVMMKADYIKLKAAERAANPNAKPSRGGDADDSGVHKFSGVNRVANALLRVNVSDMASISQHELRVCMRSPSFAATSTP